MNSMTISAQLARRTRQEHAAKQTEWKEKTNAVYQDVMKIVLSLATASLVLPLVLVKTFAIKGVPKDHLDQWAWLSWSFLFLSVVACMVFFYAAAKFLKLMSGGGNEWLTESQFENTRDWACAVSIASFFVGLLFSGVFLHALVTK